MNWRDRIVSGPEIRVGKPAIGGARISVESLPDRMADGGSMDDLLASCPYIGREDVLAALAFVSETFKEESYVALDKARS